MSQLVGINKNIIVIAISALLLIVLFKDLLRYLTYLSGLDLTVLAYFIYFLIVSPLFFKRVGAIDKISLICVAFFTFNYLILFSHFVLENRFNYSVFDFCIITVLLYFVPITLLLITSYYPEYTLLACHNVMAVSFIPIVIVGYLILFVSFLNPDLIFNFYNDLFSVGLVANPFQTASNGIFLRVSSVFYSALDFALFSNFCIVSFLYGKYSSRKAFLCLLLIMPLLFFTFNRNGYLMFVASIFMFISYRMSKTFFYYVANVIFSLVLSVAILTPFILNVNSVNTYDNNGDYSVYAKTGTLMSRFSSWADFFSVGNQSDMLTGMGFVQGISSSNIYVDNSFYDLSYQSGLSSTILFVIVLIYVWTNLMVKFKMTMTSDCAQVVTLFLIGVLSMMLNNTLFDSVYFVFFFVYVLAKLPSRESGKLAGV